MKIITDSGKKIKYSGQRLGMIRLETTVTMEVTAYRGKILTQSCKGKEESEKLISAIRQAYESGAKEFDVRGWLNDSGNGKRK